MCVFIELHITAQSGPVVLVILCHGLSIVIVVVFFRLLTGRASTIPSNIRGCQSGTWSAGQEKIEGTSTVMIDFRRDDEALLAAALTGFTWSSNSDTGIPNTYLTMQMWKPILASCPDRDLLRSIRNLESYPFQSPKTSKSNRCFVTAPDSFIFFLLKLVQPPSCVRHTLTC